jgi:hypothetical protein
VAREIVQIDVQFVFRRFKSQQVMFAHNNQMSYLLVVNSHLGVRNATLMSRHEVSSSEGSSPPQVTSTSTLTQVMTRNQLLQRHSGAVIHIYISINRKSEIQPTLSLKLHKIITSNNILFID